MFRSQIDEDEEEIIITINKKEITDKLKAKGTPESFEINQKSIGNLCIEMYDFFDLVSRRNGGLLGCMFGKHVLQNNKLRNNKIKFIYPTKQTTNPTDSITNSINDVLMHNNLPTQQVVKIMDDVLKLIQKYDKNAITRCLIQIIKTFEKKDRKQPK